MKRKGSARKNVFPHVLCTVHIFYKAVQDRNGLPFLLLLFQNDPAPHIKASAYMRTIPLLHFRPVPLLHFRPRVKKLEKSLNYSTQL